MKNLVYAGIATFALSIPMTANAAGESLDTSATNALSVDYKELATADTADQFKRGGSRCLLYTSPSPRDRG